MKFTVLTALTIAVYFKVFRQENIFEIWEGFLANITEPESFIFLLIVILLMPVNWMLEAFKWQLLTKVFVPLPFYKLLKAVLAGVSISLFTPNRIGDYGGRMLIVGPRNSWAAFMAAVVGSFSQMLVLVSVGLMGAIYVGTYLFHWGFRTYLSFLAGVGLILLIMFGVYFNIAMVLRLERYFTGRKWLSKLFSRIKLLGEYNRAVLAKALGLAALRYFTYTLQYYWMLKFYGAHLPFFEAMSGIAGIFLFQTIVPMPPVLGLVARGELALLIWNHFEVNEISILGATFSLFVINLCLPAFVGLMYIVRTNFFKPIHNEL